MRLKRKIPVLRRLKVPKYHPQVLTKLEPMPSPVVRPLLPFWSAILLFVLVLCVAGPLSAQEQDRRTETLLGKVPFEQWLREGASQQIPWKVRTWSLGLSVHQRLVMNLEVEVAGKELEKRRKGEIIALVQVTDEAGHVYRHGTVLNQESDAADSKRATALFFWNAFALPGEYKIILALYSSATGEHSLAVRKLHVHPLKHEPLPGAWERLPAVEILELESDLDKFYRPDVQGKLKLELATQRPVQLEVVADVTTSEMFHGSQRFYDRYLSYLLPTVKILSQIRVQNGVIDVTAVDRAGHAVFQQDKVDELDWDHLKGVLKESVPGKVDVQELQQHTGPLFLRAEVMRRALPSAGERSAVPLRVVILLTGPVNPYSFPKVPKESETQPCDCLVYYLQIDPRRTPYSNAHEMKKMLQPLNVRAFHVWDSQEIRNAIAEILREIGEH